MGLLSRTLAALLFVSGHGFAHAFDIGAHKITDAMAAVYTPMKRGGFELDLSIIPTYAAFLAKRNITNVLPAGSNGESLSLSVVERKALAKAWGVAAVQHGLRIYMHVGSESLVDSIDLAKHASSTPGIMGIMAMTPVYFKPSVEGLHDFLSELASAVPSMPLWFYHFPDDTGVLPGQAHKVLELAERTGSIPNLVGIKFTDYNLMDFQLCIQVGTGKYNMLYGRDEQLFAALEMGAAAGVSSTIQYAPSLRQVCANWKKGNIDGARKAQGANAALCGMFGDFKGDENVQKNIMKMVGMDVGPSRLPKRDLDAATYAQFEARLRSANLIDEASPGHVVV